MTTTALDLRVSLPLGSLDAYFQSVNRIPMLGADEERELAERFRRDNDLEAARRLVMAHLRFVVRVARGYSGYGLPQSDLIQEGNIGLMKAVKRFDPAIGVRLVSFAVHWIRAEIHEFILRNWRIVKVATTKAQRKLFFNLRSAKQRLGWLNGEEVAEVARDLGVSTHAVLEMEQRLSARDASFDPYLEAEEEQAAPANQLHDFRYEPEGMAERAQLEGHRDELLHKALASLDERSRDIVNRRWLDEQKSTLQELADHYQVSAERIRQLEKRAMKKLRTTIDGMALLPAPA